jgi:predicted AlkP superfamily pyrophosphatase or phosphodiesterase
MTGAGKNFARKISFEFLPMSASFPSMTTVATTSLLTGSFPIAHGVVADSFFNFENRKVIRVKPYLSEDAQEYLPRIIPVTDYFLLSDYWNKNCMFGIVTLGKAHEKLSDREFIDFFFGKEFELGGEFTKAMTNEGVYKAAKQFILKNQSKEFFFLIVRFSTDYLAHLYGPQSQEARAEMERLFEYLIDLNSCLAKGHQKSLIFLTSDHGHKELGSGLVSISSIMKYLAPDYKYIAANQTLLSLYREDLHIDHPEYNFARMVRLKKKHSDFYYYDKSNEKWNLLSKKIEDIEPIVLSSEQYGIDNRVGDLVLHAENFYFAYHDISYYGESDFVRFKSSHGGLSTQEIFVPCLFWSST